MFLLCISNIITNFKRSKINLIYLDIKAIKNNRVITSLLFKAFITKYGFHLNCYKLVKPKVSKIQSQLEDENAEDSISKNI